MQYIKNNIWSNIYDGKCSQISSGSTLKIHFSACDMSEPVSAIQSYHKKSTSPIERDRENIIRGKQ